jgi:hypothetical protein
MSLPAAPELSRGSRDEQGSLRTGPVGRISRSGLRAIGNVVNPRAQAITAAGMGATCAAALNHELVEEATERDLRAHRPATGRPHRGQRPGGGLTGRACAAGRDGPQDRPGMGGQVVPIDDSSRLSSKLLPSGTLKVNPAFSHGMPITEASTIDADRLEFIRS